MDRRRLFRPGTPVRHVLRHDAADLRAVLPAARPAVPDLPDPLGPAAQRVSTSRIEGRHPARGPALPRSRAYATSGRVISGDRRCTARLGLVRGRVLHVATAVPAAVSTTSRTRCGVVMT